METIGFLALLDGANRYMRVYASLLAIVAAATLVACGGGKSSDQSSAAATTGPEAAATDAGGTTAATTTALPEYPGATQEAAGATGAGAMGSSAAKILSTTDAFDKVYKWYQDKMPKGSEKAHTTMGGINSAVFMLGEAGKDQQTVTITTSPGQAGKTMITIAHVKM
jgi:hypothetical protein